jgi:hypothetical protein
MKALNIDTNRFEITLNRDEMRIISQCLNEV